MSIPEKEAIQQGLNNNTISTHKHEHTKNQQHQQTFYRIREIYER